MPPGPGRERGDCGRVGSGAAIGSIVTGRLPSIGNKAAQRWLTLAFCCNGRSCRGRAVLGARQPRVTAGIRLVNHGFFEQSHPCGPSMVRNNRSAQVVSPPSDDVLPGFPQAIKARRKTRMPGGTMRRRWKQPDGTILEWDYQHGHIELYNDRGVHRGSFDPQTGEELAGPVPGRRVEP